MLHEAFITKFREWTDATQASSIGKHTWLIPVAILLLLLLVPFVKFIRKLPRQTAIWLCAGLGMYVFGAIVYETIGLMYAPQGFLYEGLNVAIEESFEMFGAIIVIHTLLKHLRSTSGSINIKF